MRIAVEVVRARGHVNVKCTHKSTLEITRDKYLTPRGDCILGVDSNTAPCQFSQEFKEIAKSRESKIIAIILAGEYWEVIVGRGDDRMSFTHTSRIVFRKSTFVSGDTVMVEASKSARDIDRRIVEYMQNPSSRVVIVLIALSLY